MSLKAEIIDKFKDERSRNVLLAKLALVTQNIKSNRLIERSNGDEVMAVRTQLHNDLHHLNSGANKTYACEDIAGLVGLILMTRAWEGYLVGSAVSSSQSFKAFLADNRLDLEHVQWCLDKCARELMEDFARACTMSSTEVSERANSVQYSPIGPVGPVGPDESAPGGKARKNVRRLANKAKVSDVALSAYEKYLANEISLHQALVFSGIKPSPICERSGAVISALCSKAKPLRDSAGVKSDKFVQFALNYVVDQFKDGIPPDLLARYIDGQEGAASK
jgi:hypothetical protein